MEIIDSFLVIMIVHKVVRPFDCARTIYWLKRFSFAVDAEQVSIISKLEKVFFRIHNRTAESIKINTYFS